MNKSIFHIVSRMNVGGPSKIINYYHEHLHQYQYESFIICGKPPLEEGEIKPIETQHARVIYLDGLSPGASLWQSFTAFFKLLKLIRTFKPSVVHSHQAKAGLFARIAGFLTRTPKTFHTYHGHVFYGYFPPFKTKIIIFVEKILNKISSKSIAISPEILTDLTQTYKVCKPKKITLINVGIDTNIKNILPSSQNAKDNFKLPKDKIIIGFIGRLVKIKNPFAFIELAHELLKKNSQIHFVIAGDGHLKDLIIKKINSEKLEKHFTILPWVEKVELLLPSLDLLIMTSINEGTPLIIMEAMLAGIPVASTPVGGIPYLIEHEITGYLLTNDMAQNAQYLENIFKNKALEKEKIIQKAKEKIERKHSLKNLLKQTVDLYNN
jgi:glycosyltransferase involved in cell wall biosynthesis